MPNETTLLRDKWSKNPEHPPGFELENPSIQGRDARQLAMKKPLKHYL